MFQPRAAPRGLVAALGSSGLVAFGRPGKCGAQGKPDCLAWASCSRRFEHGLRLFRPKAGIFGLFGRISINFAAVWGVILLFLWNFLILFKFCRNFKFFRRKRCLPPFSRRSSFQSRAARAVLKSKLILAFVDADWVGGAAAIVQFLRSDSLLARRYRVVGASCAGRLLRKNRLCVSLLSVFACVFFCSVWTGLVSPSTREACFESPA